ncbi:MAG: hypothetical protein ACI9JN_002758, partial [Bacteroidia bacterium]
VANTWSMNSTVDLNIKTAVKDSTQYFSAVKNRLVYQLFGIEESYKQKTSHDSTVIRALNELSQPTVLLNP